jgi:PhoH-like ATPase
MISTRVGLGSKIIFLGNVAQIDNKYVSEYTNGMSVFIREFVDTDLVGHVTLQEGERSPFATLAEKRL